MSESNFPKMKKTSVILDFFKKYIGIICKKIMTENNKQLTFLEEKGIMGTEKNLQTLPDAVVLGPQL